MKFTKMHGCGNDYIFINCIYEKVNNPDKLSRTLSDRHLGIGADGLVLIGDSLIADYSMRMFNPDGTSAEMCCNALRCIGKYVYETKMTSKTTITVETIAGVKTLLLTVRQERVVEVMVDMGKPVLDAGAIPVVTEMETVKDEELTVLDRTFFITCVSVGNPHAVVFVDHVAGFPVSKYGLPMEHNLKFPNRINVEFVQVVDRNNIKMRVWERGTGETLACGTGTAASVVAGIITDRLDEDVMVHCKGGILKVHYDRNQNVIYLSGPAKKVFDGEFDPEDIY
ncbi:MAG: diaminopimelate epimerase [bacterium]|nr:diaminopimelate epimerase [bacterium]